MFNSGRQFLPKRSGTRVNITGPRRSPQNPMARVIVGVVRQYLVKFFKLCANPNYIL